MKKPGTKRNVSFSKANFVFTNVVRLIITRSFHCASLTGFPLNLSLSCTYRRSHVSYTSFYQFSKISFLINKKIRTIKESLTLNSSDRLLTELLMFQPLSNSYFLLNPFGISPLGLIKDSAKSSLKIERANELTLSIVTVLTNSRISSNER